MRIFNKNLFIIASILTALSAGAADTLPSELTLSVSPTIPKAGESFTVEAKSYAADTARSSLQWYLNGKQVASGVGVVNQTFTASSLGSVLNIDVRLVAPDGKVFSRSLTIHVADVDLIIRPATYVPAYYRGSPLATVPGFAEIYAMPHLHTSSGARIAPQNLIYDWSLNGQIQKKESGLGRNLFIVPMSDIGGLTYKISLKVHDSSGAIYAAKTVSIPTTQPQILFYLTDPLTGRSANSGVSFEVMGGKNISILSEPYYFGLISLPIAIHTWTADGVEFKQPTGKNPLLLEIEAPENAVALTNFSLLINDKKTIRQRAQAMFNIRTTQ